MDLSDSKTALKGNFLQSKLGVFFFLLCCCMIAIIVQLATKNTSQSTSAARLVPQSQVELGCFPVVVPTLKYGFALDTFLVQDNEVQNGQFLADILLAEGLDFQAIEKLVENAKPVFDFRRLRVGKPYSILSNQKTKKAQYFVYEPSIYEYIIFDLEKLTAERFEKEIQTEIKTAAGVIESSLWNAMVLNGMSFDLAGKMEDALQWSVDFSHLQKGDKFKLIYEQKYIEGEPAGVGVVKAALYQTASGADFHAIHFDTEKEDGYYDLEGKPMKSSFLKAPVKYSRISSKFNLRRFHPVLKRVRPHYGTDYAAPYGTPIYAVGNGTVTRAAYTKGNGRFVKIRHDDTYETQYLHMQKFAKGIQSGVPVKQGQVIGYVGSTGLATGPHVCFRFWKNGKQVNHLALKFPPSDSLKGTDLDAFYGVKDKYLEDLQQIEYQLQENKETAEMDKKELEAKEEDECNEVVSES